MLHDRVIAKILKDGLYTEDEFNVELKEWLDRREPSFMRGIKGEALFKKYHELSAGESPLMNVYIPVQNIDLYTCGHYSEIDSIFVSTTGIYVVEYKNYDCLVEGDKEDERWNLIYTGNHYSIKSPYKQLVKHCMNLSTFLKDRFPDDNFANAIIGRVVFSDATSISVKNCAVYNQYDYLKKVQSRVFCDNPNDAEMYRVLSTDDVSRIKSLLELYEDSSDEMKFIHNLIINGELNLKLSALRKGDNI